MAYGIKNKVKVDILSYSTCLLGESKIGKTTIAKEVCERLAGDDGYLFLEIGQERGADAIEGINHINCPTWSQDYDELTNSVGFIDVCNDIIENKSTEYPNLKVVVWDTYDQLINIAEEEVIREYNNECKKQNHPEKQAKTINSAYGGYGRGEKAAIELMMSVKAKLKSVGVETFIIGHVKTKSVNDTLTGESYEVLTSDQQQNYFNALKKNLHFLVLAYIDRNIVREKKKGKKDGTVGKVAGETRKLKYRDDNYAVDSGSRFSDIIDETDMTADSFIEALEGAIKSELEKCKVNYKSRQKEEMTTAKKLSQRVEKQEQENHLKLELDNVIEKIRTFINENKQRATVEKIKPLVIKAKELGFNNPLEVDNMEDASKILELIKE